jgi:hypothetical protein
MELVRVAELERLLGAILANQRGRRIVAPFAPQIADGDELEVEVLRVLGECRNARAHAPVSRSYKSHANPVVRASTRRLLIAAAVVATVEALMKVLREVVLLWIIPRDKKATKLTKSNIRSHRAADWTVCGTISKDQFQTDLNVPRQIVLRRDLPEAGARRVEIRIRKHRMIEGIQKLGPDLKLHCLGDADVLDRRKIEEVEPLASYRGILDGNVRMLLARLIRASVDGLLPVTELLSGR